MLIFIYIHSEINEALGHQFSAIAMEITDLLMFLVYNFRVIHAVKLLE